MILNVANLRLFCDFLNYEIEKGLVYFRCVLGVFQQIQCPIKVLQNAILLADFVGWNTPI